MWEWQRGKADGTLTRIVRAGSRNIVYRVRRPAASRAPHNFVLLVEARPAVVVEGVEGEGEVGGTEDDEEEVAEEEQCFGAGGAETEAEDFIVLENSVCDVFAKPRSRL